MDGKNVHEVEEVIDDTVDVVDDMGEEDNVDCKNTIAKKSVSLPTTIACTASSSSPTSPRMSTPAENSGAHNIVTVLFGNAAAFGRPVPGTGSSLARCTASPIVRTEKNRLSSRQKHQQKGKVGINLKTGSVSKQARTPLKDTNFALKGLKLFQTTITDFTSQGKKPIDTGHSKMNSSKNATGGKLGPEIVKCSDFSRIRQYWEEKQGPSDF